MLRALISFCVRERLVMLLLAAGVVVFGWRSTQTVPLDAIPNIGENQVIVLAAWPGRSPKDVEDQVTYPLSVSLLAVPEAKSVRGKSLFGNSFVQVTFDDGVDFYWARSRVAEQLASASAQLPEGVTPTLGPDSTALGQIFYYVLDPPPGMDLADLRSLQDFTVKYALQAVDGVSEVASIGGYVRQYQIEIDPDMLRYHDITLDRVIAAVRASNIDVGAKTVESGDMEYIIRGRGFLGSDQDRSETIEEIEQTVVMTRDGVPVRVRDLAQVQAGPEFRRGALDLDGSEAVGGVVVMRYGENPRTVIENVREKIDQLEPALEGVKIRAIYDRTLLIDETVGTLTTALWQEVLITVVVMVLFLLHVRSSLVVSVTLPMAVLMAFIAMRVKGLDANIMSLAGIAIAIGTMVDLGIVISENIYRHLAEWESGGGDGGEESRVKVIIDAATEVAPAVITAVATTVVSFLPVFFLTGRDYKLFAPLAWTKTFALTASLLVALLWVPLLSRLFLRSARWKLSTGIGVATGAALVTGMVVHFVWELAIGWALVAAAVIAAAVLFMSRERVRPLEENPVSRLIVTVYEPTLRFFLTYKKTFLLIPTAIVLAGFGAWAGLPALLSPLEKTARLLGAELNDLPGYVALKHKHTGLTNDDWIALDEGSWFYMPTLYPAASFSQTMQVLQTQDARIKEIPEVDHVLGKMGRVESALDPAPAGMIETYVMLKPRSEWPKPIRTEKEIWDDIVRVAAMPGFPQPTPLQPIEGRVIMLQSGITAPTAIRIYGNSLEDLAVAFDRVAEQLREHPYVMSKSVASQMVLSKPYVEFDVDREQAARYGMTTGMVNQVVEAALGGTNVTTTVEGRQRYPIQVRYQRQWRERIEDLRRVPVVTPGGEVVPLENLAHMTTTWGPGAISSENARLVANVTFAHAPGVGDLRAVEAIVSSLREAQKDGSLELPAGCEWEAIGSFENQVESNDRLFFLGPLLGLSRPLEDASRAANWLYFTPLGLVELVVLINLFIIYIQFRDLPITLAIFAAIPVAFAGGMIFLAAGDRIFWEAGGVELNTAIWVGFIALFGIAVDDGVVMATYLDQIFTRRRLTTPQAIREATLAAGLQRIRPCLMTTVTTIVALVPVLWATGRGAEVARGMALPIFGGMCFEFVTLFVLPVLYCGYKEAKLAAGLYDRHWEGVEEPAEAVTMASS